MMLKVKVLKREIPVQVKPVQGKGSSRQGELSDESESDSCEKREVEKCSGVENALDDSAIVRVSWPDK